MSDWSYTYNEQTLLYDDNGNTIPYDSSKIYTLTASIKANDTLQSHTQYIEAVNKDGCLGYRSNTTGTACYFYYTVRDKEVYTAYFNAGDGNNELPTGNAWASSGDQIEVLYPLNSQTAYPYDSSNTYRILSVFYVDGTTITDETLSPYSISSSVSVYNNPYASGKLSIKTKVNNKILGNPCGCTFTLG